ncbi:BnaAnng21110D [Brassica napus]|uniref:BnaAnng21110D protein n=1 Tax=Brassica napus TaxID=3708 RepID=A0A078JJ45_BRANA|nr:BnaAnng21110D [Brassica napus]
MGRPKVKLAWVEERN